jgi:hypothetical protein
LNLNCRRQRRPEEVEGRPKMTHFWGFRFYRKRSLSTLDS